MLLNRFIHDVNDALGCPPREFHFDHVEKHIVITYGVSKVGACRQSVCGVLGTESGTRPHAILERLEIP